MDEMKINLETPILKGMLAREIEKLILKKCGVKPTLTINDLYIELKDDKIYFQVDVNGGIDKTALLKINRLTGA